MVSCLIIHLLHSVVVAALLIWCFYILVTLVFICGIHLNKNSLSFLSLCLFVEYAVQFFRSFHAAYVDAVSNPFHVPGKKITSRTFAERVSTIVKSFGLSSAGWITAASIEAKPLWIILSESCWICNSPRLFSIGFGSRWAHPCRSKRL